MLLYKDIEKNALSMIIYFLEFKEYNPGPNLH
jgi:hypothetical protein